MDVQNSAERFEQAVSCLCQTLRDALMLVPRSAKSSAQEVRLRVGAPVALTCPGQTWFLGRGGELHNTPQGFRVSREEIADSIVILCGHSVHSHQQEIKNGYITLRGGHRAGLGGTAVLSGGEVAALREITSVNLRVAREVCGAADALIERVFARKLCGMLIAGPPSSGKTTLLRDLARQLSGGATGRYYRVAVVDERCEIAAVCEGVPQLGLGPCCDILSGYPKGEGILTAVRTLSPQVVVCDEIGAGGEVDGILDGLHCGVKVIASAHADSVSELLRRGQIRRLMERGAFERVALLGRGDAPGQVVDILEVGEMLDQDGGNVPSHSMLLDDGNLHGIRLVRKGYGD